MVKYTYKPRKQARPGPPIRFPALSPGVQPRPDPDGVSPPVFLLGQDHRSQPSRRTGTLQKRARQSQTLGKVLDSLHEKFCTRNSALGILGSASPCALLRRCASERLLRSEVDPHVIPRHRMLALMPAPRLLLGGRRSKQPFRRRNCFAVIIGRGHIPDMWTNHRKGSAIDDCISYLLIMLCSVTRVQD